MDSRSLDYSSYSPLRTRKYGGTSRCLGSCKIGHSPHLGCGFVQAAMNLRSYLWLAGNEGMDPYSSPYATHYNGVHFLFHASIPSQPKASN